MGIPGFMVHFIVAASSSEQAQGLTKCNEPMLQKKIYGRLFENGAPHKKWFAPVNSANFFLLGKCASIILLINVHKKAVTSKKGTAALVLFNKS
jgi:hypothetical protein